MKKYFYTLIAILSSQISFSQAQTFVLVPADVDPGYAGEEDSTLVAYDLTNQINKLFIWLGGTDADSEHDYTSLKNLSVNLGYHFINLNYIDTVPAAPLGNDPDSLVFDKFRQEVCFGTPLSSYATVDTFNSVYTRAIKTLQHLATTYPSQNWGQYLATSNTLDWTKIVVGGHSQGGGLACYLAKNYPVERVIMASAPNDYHQVYNRSARWLRQPGVTPVERHYSYLSLNDEIVPYARQFANITGLGMLMNDDSTHVDNTTTPYGNSHCLYTTQPPGIFIFNHNATIMLSVLNGQVWTYMLTDPITLSITESEKDNFKIYSNPVENILYLHTDVSLANEKYTIYNLAGQIILSGSLSNGSIDVSMLEKGVYLVRVGERIEKFVRN